MKRAVVLAGTVALVAGLLVGPAMAQSYVAGLTVEKVVTGDGAPDGAQFAFSLDCDNGEYTQDFTLGDGDAETFEDVPQGAVCTLTETIPDGADFEDIDFSTVYAVNPESAWDDFDLEARSITLTIPDEDGASVFVTATNDFGDEAVLGSGELVVTKRVSGDADGEWEFEVACPGSVNETVVLGADESTTFNIVRGVDTTCTITEVAAEGYTTTYSVDGGDAVEGLEASFLFDDESVPLDVNLVREVEFTNTEDETEVLADTGLEVSWGLLLAAGLLLPGAGAVIYARKRDRKEA